MLQLVLSLTVLTTGMGQDIDRVAAAVLQAHQGCGDDAACKTKVLADVLAKLNVIRDAQPARCDCAAKELPKVTGSVGKASWGMTRQQIRQAYGDVDTSSGQYQRSSSVAGLSALQDFGFTTGGQLYFIRNVVTHQFRQPIEYVRKYQDFHKLLTAKYGKPTKSGADWLNPLFADHPEHHGLAVKQGHVKLFASWATAETLVELHLYEDDGIWIESRYFSAVLQQQVVQQVQAQRLGDL